MPMTTDQAVALRGQTVVDNDGDKIGTVEEIYLDADTDQPEWLAVKTGLFGGNVSFIPIAEAADEGGTVRVPYSKAQVKDAPNADPDGRLSQDEEARLYQHYGLNYNEQRSDSGLPEGGTGTATTGGTDEIRDREAVGHDTSGPTTDHAMTRSEEELAVGKAERETGRARLKKYIVEDQVQQTVPIRREEVRVEREPITDANMGDAMDGPELSEEEHEVTLHEETPVAEKRVVPKERVRLDKDVETTEAQIDETVRKEQIDVDDQGLSNR